MAAAAASSTICFALCVPLALMGGGLRLRRSRTPPPLPRYLRTLRIGQAVVCSKHITPRVRHFSRRHLDFCRSIFLTFCLPRQISVFRRGRKGAQPKPFPPSTCISPRPLIGRQPLVRTEPQILSYPTRMGEIVHVYGYLFWNSSSSTNTLTHTYTELVTLPSPLSIIRSPLHQSSPLKKWRTSPPPPSTAHRTSTSPPTSSTTGPRASHLYKPCTGSPPTGVNSVN